jgi:uncharacterized protein (TIGR00299 family) protein
MRIAYFHCYSGISGDMTLGALVDAGVDPEELKVELGKIPLEGYEISFVSEKRNGLAGTRCQVEVGEDHPHRHLDDILEIIEASSLPSEDRERITKVFGFLAEGEARVHGESSHHVHFHEVGAVDSIVDIAGAVIGLRLLGIEALYCSPLHLGSGFVRCQHGTIPVPAPATLELLKGIPVYSTGIQGELVTPTGAALVGALADGFGPYPAMEIEGVGYGVGKAELPIPNLLRVVVGRQKKTPGIWSCS